MALEVIHTLARTPSHRRRALASYRLAVEQHPLAYICGPTPFVERAAAELLPLGYEPTRIKTERFGPTGGS